MTAAEAATASWPRAIFNAPLFRGLDERGRTEIERAGNLRTVPAGTELYARGDRGDTLFVLAEGSVALRAQPRGAGGETERRVDSGESFGEEASVGATRRATATAAGRCVVAEVPVAMFRRALGRAGGGEVADRFERRLRRRAATELLRSLAFTRALDDTDLELLLDGVTYHNLDRGDVVYRAHEPADELWLVADGMVQLQAEDDERIRVKAYLTRGDFFGDELLAGSSLRAATAVVSGGSLLVAVSAKVARTVTDRNPGVLARLRRMSHDHEAGQQKAIAAAAAKHTQHAFRDLYRLQIAQSLLVIDLNSCVRCGHCAWICEALHGVARLVRSGDKIVTRAGPEPQHQMPLLLPNSCQHCHNPACMPDCPTGAIGRDPGGEVYIRDELCTGCGACAKGCPWDNINIVPRPASASRPTEGAFPELAVKCDLCRDYDGPACVKACPTDAIHRINPSDDLPEVRALLGTVAKPEAGLPQKRNGGVWPFALATTILAMAGATYGTYMHTIGRWTPREGIGWAMGIVAAVSFLLLLAYVFPKRLVKLWSRKTKHKSTRVQSKTRIHMLAHGGLGLISLSAVFSHGGLSPRELVWPDSSGAVLSSAYLATALLGIAAAMAYAWVPRRLSRIERTASLPEEYTALRRDLIDRLYSGVTGRSEVVKRLFEKVLVPYLRASLGWCALLASGRTLREESDRLRERIETILQGRGHERLAGMDELIRMVVELRASTAQRVLTALLRCWLPLHVMAGAGALVVLIIHIIEVV